MRQINDDEPAVTATMWCGAQPATDDAAAPATADGVTATTTTAAAEHLLWRYSASSRIIMTCAIVVCVVCIGMSCV